MPVAQTPRGPVAVPDVLALDFAPSYNFNLDCFNSDDELVAAQRAARFAPHLHDLANQAAEEMFGAGAGGESGRFLAAHLRRDGYESYCAGSGLDYFGRRRYGVRVTPAMCYPSVGRVVEALGAAAARHGLARVLLATNSVDEDELAQLRTSADPATARLDVRRWTPPPRISERHPEWVPAVELLLCARAAAFVGTLPSTFSATVLAQRDALGHARNTTAFFGQGRFFG